MAKVADLKKGGDFLPHPETDGVKIKAVVVDLTPLEKKDTKYGSKEMFAIVFETAWKNEDGDNWTIWKHGLTMTWGDKSTLKALATTIMGIGELDDNFDTDDLLFRPVELIVGHKVDGEKTYANIDWIKADTTGEGMKPSGKYVRKQDRDKTKEGGSAYGKADTAGAKSTAPAADADAWKKTKIHVGNFAGQDLENVDAEVIKGLIEKWVTKKYYEAGYKPTADDKRLYAALQKAAPIVGATFPAPPEKDDF